MKRLLLALSIVTTVSVVSTVTYSQVVYEPVTNNGVYELLDELATLKVITMNSVVKPYSRVYIAEKLREADQRTSGRADKEKGGQADRRTGGQVDSVKVVRVSKRLKQEIEFYLRDYAFELGIKNEELGINSSKLKVQSSKEVMQDTMLAALAIQDPRSKIQDGEQTKVHPASCILHPASLNYDPLSFNIVTKPFRMSLRPAFGTRFIVNENGHVWDVTGGGEVFGYVGKHVGYYFNVKQTWQSEALVKPEYFTIEEGKVWKDAGNGSVTNTEWRGGISVAWKWGDFGVYKDRPIWGNGVHGTNILSGHAPSFPFIQLHLKPAKWIEFRYIHGWLKSNVLDSLNVQEHYSGDLKLFNKFIAANIVTFFPWKGLGISIGNSVIYSSQNVQLFYILPFAFYNSVGATVSIDNNIQDNYQLFVELSSRNLKHLNLFLTLYIDEFKVSRVKDPNQYNFLCWKGGIEIYDFPLKNLQVATEFYFANSGVYQHFIPAEEFSSDGYCLGNFLKENSFEIFTKISYKLLRNLKSSISFNYSIHGEDTRYSSTFYPDKVKPLTNPTFTTYCASFDLSYKLLNNITLFAGYLISNHYGDVARIPIFFRGKNSTFTTGLNVNF